MTKPKDIFYFWQIHHSPSTETHKSRPQESLLVFQSNRLPGEGQSQGQKNESRSLLVLDNQRVMVKQQEDSVSKNLLPWTETVSFADTKSKPHPNTFTISEPKRDLAEGEKPSERLNSGQQLINRSGSVVGLESSVLLSQLLYLLHQRLIDRVFLYQTVDLILEEEHQTSFTFYISQHNILNLCVRVGSYQLDVKLSNHLDLKVDDVSVTGVSEEQEKQDQDHLLFSDVNKGGNETETDLKSSRVSWIMFWMKWIWREVRGAAPPCPTTCAMFWEREEDTAADRAAPEHTDSTVRNHNIWTHFY